MRTATARCTATGPSFPKELDTSDLTLSSGSNSSSTRVATTSGVAAAAPHPPLGRIHVNNWGRAMNQGSNDFACGRGRDQFYHRADCLSLYASF